MTTVVDLSARLFPPRQYYPYPTLVPTALRMTAADWVAIGELKQLGSCAADGPDSIYIGRVAPAPELSMDPDAKVEPITIGGLVLHRYTGRLTPDGPALVVWSAVVTGLTFGTDTERRVIVDSPTCRVVLRASDRDGAYLVYPRERRKGSPTGVPVVGEAWEPAGKPRTYASYADLVDARNAQRIRGSHGRVPDAMASVLTMTPMIGRDRTSTTRVTSTVIAEPDGVSIRRLQRYTLEWDEATAKRLHGEKAGSNQAVLRYDTTQVIETDESEVGSAVGKLLSKFDTESWLVVNGLVMNAVDTNNRWQRVGAADLARIRGRELAGSGDRKRFNEIAKLVTEAQIRVRPVKGDGSGMYLNLFARQGEVVAPGGARLPVVTLNDALYRSMLRTGHGVLMDRAILTVNLRNHEWEPRIYGALAHQWSLGWVVHHAKGKPLRRTANQLLLESGISYDLQADRKKHGGGYVRHRLGRVFDSLVSMGWVKSWKLHKETDNPGTDLYEFVPADTYARALNAHRAPALTKGKRV